ncbi:radical SAM family heme chaperone HemW [bacterium]|nr:radical SAM family heme chaperone HemW [bacterium]
MTKFALYIHYPFCIKRCNYCAFVSSVIDDKIANSYQKVLLTELKQKADEQPWRDGKIRSAYFGGGTPSLMPVDFIEILLNTISNSFCLTPETEITIETNPGSDVNDRFKEFFKLGINRLSIGAQSFNDDELKLLGRIHSTDDICDAVQAGREAGFENISLDLLYGIPGQTVNSFQTSLQKALDLNPTHLSTYALSIEDNTPFARMVKNGSLSAPDPDLAADQYSMLIDVMKNAGFNHYELTNYSKSGFESTHNKTYWQRTPYLGIGTAAHSFDGQKRFWNTNSIETYIRNLKSDKIPLNNTEFISPPEQIEEQLYLGLRTSAGLDVDFARKHFSKNTLRELVLDGFLNIQHRKYLVPEKKWLLLDEVVLKILSTS